MLHWTDVVDAESSQAFQTKFAGTKGDALGVETDSLTAEFGPLLELQLASMSNDVITATRVNLCNTCEQDFINSA